MRFLLCLLTVLLTVRSASADAPTPLAVEVHAGRLDQAAFQSVLTRELSTEEGQGGRLTVRESVALQPATSLLQIEYIDAQGHREARDLEVAVDDPEALDKVALASVNLVRNEARSLLEQLENSKIAAAAGVADGQGAAKQDRDDEVPPPLPSRPELTFEAPSPPPYDPCNDGEVMAVGADLAPFVGVSTWPRNRERHRKLSFGLAGALSAGVRGFELSIGANIAQKGMCGLAMALGNLSLGPVVGMQLGLGNVARDVHGLQLGVGNISVGRAGVQLGVGNFARKGARAQLGVGNLALGEVRALQMGLGNFARHSVGGLQLGLGNITVGRARVQYGVFNYAHSARAPVGIISIVRDGRTTLDSWITESGTFQLGLTHGGDIVYNLYGIGFRFGPAGTRMAYTLGTGVILAERPRHTWAIEWMTETMLRTDYVEPSAYTGRVRVAGTIRLSERVGLLIAPGYTLMWAETEERSQSPFGETVFLSRQPSRNDGKEGRLLGFASLSVGVRVKLTGS